MRPRHDGRPPDATCSSSATATAGRYPCGRMRRRGRSGCPGRYDPASSPARAIPSTLHRRVRWLACPRAPDPDPPRDDPRRARWPPHPRRAGARPGRREAAGGVPNPAPTRSSRYRCPAEEIVAELDAAIVTHLHEDHFDETGARLLPPDVPVFCQPEDAEHLRGRGLDARPVDARLAWEGLRIVRTAGGMARTMPWSRSSAPVSGFLLDGLYVVGDTVWCREVEEAIERHRPRVAVVNGSGARFLTGGPIVMTAEQVGEVVERCRPSSSSTSRRSTTASKRVPRCVPPSRTPSSPRTARCSSSSRPPRRSSSSSAGR